MRRFSSMTAKADDGSKGAVRARQAWLVLIGKAYERKTVRYDEIADIMGYSDSRMLGAILAKVAYYCLENDLPPLTVLVVNREGKPGAGFVNEIVPISNLDSEREKVYEFGWYDICPPTAKRLQESANRAVENA